MMNASHFRHRFQPNPVSRVYTAWKPLRRNVTWWPTWRFTASDALGLRRSSVRSVTKSSRTNTLWANMNWFTLTWNLSSVSLVGKSSVTKWVSYLKYWLHWSPFYSISFFSWGAQNLSHSWQAKIESTIDHKIKLIHLNVSVLFPSLGS